jgi:hypothetical protein
MQGESDKDTGDAERLLPRRGEKEDGPVDHDQSVANGKRKLQAAVDPRFWSFTSTLLMHELDGGGRYKPPCLKAQYDHHINITLRSTCRGHKRRSFQCRFSGLRAATHALCL